MMTATIESQAVERVKEDKVSRGDSLDTFQDYKNVYKVVLIGNSYCGKTSLLVRFVENKFEGDYLNTVGVDLKSQSLKVDGTLVRLNIWDTAGQEKFKSVSKQYYRNSHGALAVFDLTDIKSYK